MKNEIPANFYLSDTLTPSDYESATDIKTPKLMRDAGLIKIEHWTCPESGITVNKYFFTDKETTDNKYFRNRCYGTTA